jgi:fatty acid desaturase
VGTAASAVRSSKARQCVRTIVADLHFVNSSNQLEARSAAVGRAPAAAVGCPGLRRWDRNRGVHVAVTAWWAAAFVVIAASGVFLSRRRWRSAFLLGMGTSFVLGAFIIQVSGPNSSGESG